MRLRGMVAAALAAAWFGIGIGMAEPCKMVLVGTLPVSVTKNGRVLVDGSIAGKPAKFLLDTGAATTMADQRAFSEFRVNDAGLLAHHVYGIGGEAATGLVSLPDWMIGTYKGGTIRMYAFKDLDLGEGVYGLLGSDFLSHFGVELDLADGKVNLFQPGLCPGQQVYWSTAFSQASIYFASRDNHDVEVHVSINNHDASAILDTGSPTSVFSWHMAEQLGITLLTPNVFSADKITGVDSRHLQSNLYRFDSFAIADEEIAHPMLRLADLFNKARIEVAGSRISRDVFDADGLLGVDFILAHRIFIDFDGGMIYFNYLGGPVFSQAQSKTIASSRSDGVAH